MSAVCVWVWCMAEWSVCGMCVAVRVCDREAWSAAVHGGDKELNTTEQLNSSNK